MGPSNTAHACDEANIGTKANSSNLREFGITDSNDKEKKEKKEKKDKAKEEIEILQEDWNSLVIKISDPP